MSGEIDSFIRTVEGFDEKKLVTEIESLRVERQRIDFELQKRIEAVESQRRWRRQRNLDRPRGPVSPLPAEEPRGTEAVRRVMASGDVMTIREIYEALEKRDWINPEAMHPLKATETAINRLFKAGELERVGRGRYRLVQSPGAAPLGIGRVAG